MDHGRVAHPNPNGDSADDDDDDDDKSPIVDNTNNNNHKENANDRIRPFEWLTSPASLTPLLLQQQDVWSSSTNGCRILHLGSGSSIWSEYLLSSEFPLSHRIAKIINVDKDAETVSRMQHRWNQQQQHVRNNKHKDDTTHSKLDFWCLDWVQERVPLDNQTLNVILDKSTLDCTLCSDSATAWLLHQVYRLLRVGGLYCVVSFHALELLVPLISQCPGTHWSSVTTHVIPRQVERLDHRNDDDNNNANDDNPSHSLVSPHDNNTSRTVNVVMARRGCPPHEQQEEEEPELDITALYHHAHKVNDDWYQTLHPLLTPQRLSQLRQAFTSTNLSDDESFLSLELPDCYQVLFTTPEREQYTYDYFLQDWQAFVQSHASQHQSEEEEHDDDDEKRPLPQNSMTLETALLFLEEMQ